MTRVLRIVRPDGDVLGALRDALAGGPALFVSSGGAGDLPETVEQRIALVVETSGSTGRPKRVMLSADAVLASAAACESALGGPGQWVLVRFGPGSKGMMAAEIHPETGPSALSSH